jgi:SAM-dependent methyltransferase
LPGPLSHAGAYSVFQRLLGARAAQREAVERHARVQAGERVLDLGCGPADVLEVLPDTDYLGVDASPRYITAARRRWHGRARFACADVTGVEPFARERFDVVLALSVLHHLDDDRADRMLAAAADRLAGGGRLVTLDPAQASEQPRLARWVLARDRGSHLRAPEHYRRLAERRFAAVDTTVRRDLARFGIVHVILDCRAPRAGAA